MAALTYRLHTVGVLSDWHYQSLYIDLSSRGYRKKEPDEGQRETSQILQKVFMALRDESISKGHIAAELCVPAEELDKLVLGSHSRGSAAEVPVMPERASRPCFVS